MKQLRAPTGWLFARCECACLCASLSVPLTSLPLTPTLAHKTVLYVCVSTDALQTGSSVPSFHTCMLMYDIVCDNGLEGWERAEGWEGDS